MERQWSVGRAGRGDLRQRGAPSRVGGTPNACHSAILRARRRRWHCAVLPHRRPSGEWRRAALPGERPTLRAGAASCTLARGLSQREAVGGVAHAAGGGPFCFRPLAPTRGWCITTKLRLWRGQPPGYATHPATSTACGACRGPVYLVRVPRQAVCFLIHFSGELWAGAPHLQKHAHGWGPCGPRAGGQSGGPRQARTWAH